MKYDEKAVLLETLAIKLSERQLRNLAAVSILNSDVIDKTCQDYLRPMVERHNEMLDQVGHNEFKITL